MTVLSHYPSAAKRTVEPSLKDPQYRCFNGLFDVKHVTFGVACASAAVTVAYAVASPLIFYLAGYFLTAPSPSFIVSWILSVVIPSTVIACLFYGLHKERGAFLLPYIAFSVG